MSDVRTGGCLCGAVKLRATLKEEGFGACHCSICRRWSGGAPFFAVQAKAEVTEGADKVTVYASSDWAERAFCATCGANLWYRVTMPGPHQGAMHLAWGALDDASGMALTSEVFIDEKPESYDLAGDRPRMTGEELFAMVMAAGETGANGGEG